MTKAKLQIAKIVKQDLKEASIWYNRERKGLGSLFLKDINEKVNQIRTTPLSYELRYANIRIAFAKKFPYGIHYEYDTTKNQVNILGIFHTSRNPEVWKND